MVLNHVSQLFEHLHLALINTQQSHNDRFHKL